MIKKVKRLLKPVIKRLLHGGTKRKCPVCNKQSRRFLERGIVPRVDAQCPFCGAVERHRLVWRYLETKTDFKSNPPEKALHIAPAICLESKLRALIGDGYVTGDLYKPKVDFKIDITDIQFPENHFDFIFCSHVLEHVPDDRKAMREFCRVLTPDGFALLIVPIYPEKTIEDPSIVDPKERLRLFGQDDHVRKYGPDFCTRLEEEGFAVETIRKEDLLSPDEIEVMGLARCDRSIYICRKSK